MGNARNKITENYISDEQLPKFLKRQSQIDFESVKTNQNFDVNNFKNKELMSDKPIYLGLTILEW